MTVNEYVRQWCDEDYDINKEDFYMQNAYYVASRERAIGGFKHGVVVMIISVLMIVFGSRTDIGKTIINALSTLGALTVCFWFYAAQEYDANSWESSKPHYIMIALFLLWTNIYVNDSIRILFIIASGALFVYLTFINPLLFIISAIKMRDRMKMEENEEDERDRAAYAKWENSYKAFRYGLPEMEVDGTESDPVMAEARAMFEGYTDNLQVLKTRYRQLAKQHHPDRGGDTKMFQCISAIYDELKQIIAA
jgi:hypothetical protein